jgi:hypothetical protein
MAAKRRAKMLQYARLEGWRQRVNSFPDLTHRPASDILVELGIG